MAQRGRPPLGPDLVDHLDGPEETKMRLKILLETVAGTRTIPDACDLMGISESRFHEWRNDALKAFLGVLEPKPLGRPPKETPDDRDDTIADLLNQMRDLKRQMEAARIRAEIALVAPHLLKPDPPPPEEKKRPQTGRRKKRR